MEPGGCFTVEYHVKLPVVKPRPMTENRGMGAVLPDLGFETFRARLVACSPLDLGPSTVEALFLHYRELRRWNPRLSLVGPGTAEAVVERHYGESLAALPLIGRGPRRLVDVGAGAGFPGWVLAAARPELEVYLVESRQKKWSFLRTVSRGASLSCHCLNARVEAALPEEFPRGIDLVTVRAVKLASEQMVALADRMNPGGAFLLWAGRQVPDLPEGFERGRSRRLGGSENLRILEILIPG